MKLHQVKKIKGAGSRVAGASVDNEHEVAEVVDGTLEQALHFKRTNRQPAKNKSHGEDTDGAAGLLLLAGKRKKQGNWKVEKEE
uniref:Uncharacterized protein 2B n=1 Tax=Sorghum bicolor TaxID=4558 RepID=Q84YF8_SORBI|nr:hypothetical protein [Sorghum bicolor]